MSDASIEPILPSAPPTGEAAPVPLTEPPPGGPEGAPVAAPTTELDLLLATIRGGIASDPSDLPARAAARDACRVIALALDAAPGQPLAAAASQPVAALPVATIVETLRKVPPDQLLDLAIQRLRAALPAGVEVPSPTPMRFHLVPILPVTQ